MRRAPWTIALATALVMPTLLAARRRGRGPERSPRQRRPPLRHPHRHRRRTHRRQPLPRRAHPRRADRVDEQRSRLRLLAPGTQGPTGLDARKVPHLLSGRGARGQPELHPPGSTCPPAPLSPTAPAPRSPHRARTTMDDPLLLPHPVFHPQPARLIPSLPLGHRPQQHNRLTTRTVAHLHMPPTPQTRHRMQVTERHRADLHPIRPPTPHAHHAQDDPTPAGLIHPTTPDVAEATGCTPPADRSPAPARSTPPPPDEPPHPKPTPTPTESPCGSST